jgi:LmbE family N-acetylglucosaminyl deacetylase
MGDRVLVVAPHPDDEAIGCGGQLLRHTQAGGRVQAVFLTSGERGLPELPAEQVWRIREAEARRAARVLGLERLSFLRLPDGEVRTVLDEGSRGLSVLLEQSFPTIIYLPHPADHHPDHLATLPLVRRALERWKERSDWPRLLGYEVWTPMGRWNRIEDVTPFMARKLQAIRCYPSQLRFFRYDHAVRGLNRHRGIMAGHSRYGEAYVKLPAEEPMVMREEQTGESVSAVMQS